MADDPGYRKREVTREEFDEIRTGLIKTAPRAIKSKEELQRWLGPRLQEALTKAQYTPEGSALGRFAGGVWKSVNPLPLVKTALEVARDPSQLRTIIAGIGEQSADQFQQARALAGEGDYLGAAGHAIGTIPLIGPGVVEAGEKIAGGDWAGGAGELAGMFAPVGAATKLARRGVVRVPALLRNRNPVAAADVAWARSGGIPVDAATATGSEYLAGIKRISEHSALGSVAAKQRQFQLDELERAGRQIAGDVSASPATRLTAGANVVDDVARRESLAKAAADTEYGQAREIQALPEHTQSRPRSKAVMARLNRERMAKMRETLGDSAVPTQAELVELEGIYREMETMQFSQRRLRKVDRGHGGDFEHVKGTGGAGAPVYDDILAATDYQGSATVPYKPTRGHVTLQIQKALESGNFRGKSARGALEVARKRARARVESIAEGVTPRTLPPGVTGSLIPKDELLQLPVDIRRAKAALKPVYDDLLQVTPVGTQQVSKSFKALEALVTGDADYLPAMQVDKLLSGLKNLERAGKEVADAGPRTAARGLAAHAIKPLEEALQATLEQAPEMGAALQRGRSAVRGQYQIKAVRKALGKEPVRLISKLTQRGDASIRFLEQVEDLAPGRMKEIGRAVLDDLLNTATKSGGFEKAPSLRRAWESMGPQTRAKLYGKQHADDIDRFFRIAEKITENPNPSGSGLTVTKAGQLMAIYAHPASGIPLALTGAALAKALNNPRVARLLAEGGRIPIRSKAARAAYAVQLGRALEPYLATEDEREAEAARTAATAATQAAEAGAR